MCNFGVTESVGLFAYSSNLSPTSGQFVPGESDWPLGSIVDDGAEVDLSIGDGLRREGEKYLVLVVSK